VEWTTLITGLVKTSIALTVFALGLQTRIEDVLSLRLRPALLARSLLAMSVVMPLAAVTLAKTFDLHPAVKIALVALALSPVPPLVLKNQLQAGAGAQYASGLMVAAALFAVVFVPLALEGIGRVFALSLHQSPLEVAWIILLSVLAPISLGLLAGNFVPGLAQRVAKWISLLSFVLLVLALGAILFNAAPAMVSLVGNGTLLAFAVFIVLGLVFGHALGGPEPGDRTVLARSTALRHPGVALAIATANFPEQKLVLPAILLYLLVGAMLSVPYARWRRRSDTVRAEPSTMPVRNARKETR
jgi:BASS family bile acid:Na+ symporter